MADKQKETTSAEQVNEQSEVSPERAEYLTRIMEELKVAFSAAVAGDYMRVNGNDTVMPPAELRTLRDRLQSLRDDFMAAFESEGRARKLMADTPTGHVSNFSAFSFQADMHHPIRNVRDSKSAYGQIPGFCVTSVYQVFFEQAQHWAAIAALTGSLPPPQRAAALPTRAHRNVNKNPLGPIVSVRLSTSLLFPKLFLADPDRPTTLAKAVPAELQ
ncbi:MAG: hypothetical protein LQ341_006745 [Variospora aurantia]|nr:MAG: hypothetical protein LQ341_006745 [Variospora aurantia]